MRCPYCQTPISERTPACPRCALNTETAGNAFGSVPPLQRGVNDNAQVFSEAQRRRVQGALVGLHDHFPQVHLSVFTVSVSAETGLAAYAFWIFNRSGLCPTVERGGSNHDILLTLDTRNRRSHIIFGYGLEPFAGEELAREILSSAGAQFHAGDWAGGAVTVAETLQRELASLATELDRAFGINVSDFYSAEKERLAEISGTGDNAVPW